MLDSYHRHQIHNNLKFNSISGTLVKTHPDSWFERYHLKSVKADKRLSEESGIITLQTMVVGEMQVISEVVRHKDYFTTTDKEDPQ